MYTFVAATKRETVARDPTCINEHNRHFCGSFLYQNPNTMARTKKSTRQPTGSGKSIPTKAPRSASTPGTSRKSLRTSPLKSLPGHDGKRHRRYRPGTVALREIRRYQNSTHLLVPRAPFQRVVREVALTYKDQLLFQAAALEALHEAAEAYLVCLFEDANL